MLRILVLALVLLFVAADAWLTRVRSTDWDRPLRVVVYPIAAEDDPAVSAYLSGVSKTNFDAIESYFREQAQHYGISMQQPVDVFLGPVIGEMPPLPPQGGNMLQVAWWSLKLRFWMMRADEYQGPRPHIRVLALYHKLEDGKRLPHSTGLSKGMVCLVHVFADPRYIATNNVVVVHELMHTLGATDKYDLGTGLPIFPQGFAEPELSPPYPQNQAEIMGAYIPVSEVRAIQPHHLAETRVGETTAKEIGWTR